MIQGVLCECDECFAEYLVKMIDRLELCTERTEQTNNQCEFT